MCMVMMSNQCNAAEVVPGGKLTDEQVTRFARLALDGIVREYPNKPSNVMVGRESVLSPQEMHPVFYGCFDWHSSVHGHWMLVRLLKLYPQASVAGEIRELLDAQLTADKLQVEAEYFDAKENRSFERTYGWAWTLRLAAELKEWDDPDAQRWAKNLEPLESRIVELTKAYLPRLTYPIRTGVHPDTAFALGQMLDYARVVNNEELESLITTYSREKYLSDRSYPSRFEPSGEDFFSTAWNEADLMRRVLGEQEFAEWLEQFLPDLDDANSDAANLLNPAEVSDLTDPKIVHLVGLNLRALAGDVLCLPAHENWLRAMSDERPVANPELRRRWRFGPGFVVTAAFIGPGTVITAGRAGALYGYSLLWTLLLAVLATIVLQEMAGRLGLVARRGLAAAISDSIQSAWARRMAALLVLSAIVLGNTAYQTGNLMGAGMGFSILCGAPAQVGAVVLGSVVLLLLGIGGSIRQLMNLLIVVVVLMSIAFVGTALLVRPEAAQLATGAATFRLPEGSVLTAMALIGTTVVPYNLFLHARVVQERWSESDALGESLRESRIDTLLAVALGGLVTMAILVTAAVAYAGDVVAYAGGAEGTIVASDLAQQLEPLLGAKGKYLFAAGLLAAGFTSAVTAPLAAGYVVAESINRPSPRVAKAAAMAVALLGTILAAASGKSPQATIVFAQAANGLLLPLVAVFLLWTMNRRELLGQYCNNRVLNVAALAVVGIAAALGVKTLVSLAY
ncbi:Divalent metal cation transporter MntH [Durusdinium trenchii]|uniref:Divalent metal cation transporter MntH n=1 Tax=Durusdinium trenchii TaxID=1381693 RepID=A0ABP0LE36_9DINO